MSKNDIDDFQSEIADLNWINDWTKCRRTKKTRKKKYGRLIFFDIIVSDFVIDSI